MREKEGVLGVIGENVSEHLSQCDSKNNLMIFFLTCVSIVDDFDNHIFCISVIENEVAKSLVED